MSRTLTLRTESERLWANCVLLGRLDTCVDTRHVSHGDVWQGHVSRELRKDSGKGKAIFYNDSISPHTELLLDLCQPGIMKRTRSTCRAEAVCPSTTLLQASPVKVGEITDSCRPSILHKMLLSNMGTLLRRLESSLHSYAFGPRCIS